MIRIVLSEQEFDYEIQALVNSFFPGERSRIYIWGEDIVDEKEDSSVQETVREYPKEGAVGIETAREYPKEESAGQETVREYPKEGCFQAEKAEKIGLHSEADFGAKDSELKNLWIFIDMAKANMTIRIQSGHLPWYTGQTAVSGTDDWHKKEGKKTHPYRSYYKNELKKLLFTLLRDLPKEYLTSSGGYRRRIPVWGTMTGVRPTKIVMNQLLAGASREQVRRELQETYLCSPEKTELGLEIATKEASLLQKIHYEQGYSLYISIPFCPTTCLYCSFPSYPWQQFSHLAERYLQALKTEIHAMADAMGDRTLSSVYIGGGTPTTLSASQLRELILHVRSCYPVSEACEFTVEAGRPDSITREKLEVLQELGVERISVNPQTMQQRTLDLIGRRHTVQDTVATFHLARELGFQNINMDLIIGLPGETVDDFRDTLQQIRALDPDSLTIHSLVIKRASRLRSVLEEQAAAVQISLEELERGRGEQLEQMLLLGEQFARESGYEPYYMYRQKNSAGHAGSTGQENIGFARPGRECLYNILIMEEKQTIVAVGAGASTKLYHEELGQVSRVENVKSVTDYIDRVDEMISRKYQLLQEN